MLEPTQNLLSSSKLCNARMHRHRNVTGTVPKGVMAIASVDALHTKNTRPDLKTLTSGSARFRSA